MKSKNIHTIKCIYCEKLFLKELNFKAIEMIIQCVNCGEKSKLTIGDVNCINELYRGKLKDKTITTKGL